MKSRERRRSQWQQEMAGRLSWWVDGHRMYGVGATVCCKCGQLRWWNFRRQRGVCRAPVWDMRGATCGGELVEAGEAALAAFNLGGVQAVLALVEGPYRLGGRQAVCQLLGVPV